MIKAWVIELPNRPECPIFGCERYIPGEYRKHNNNNGYVSEYERNTPQTFSHFTYEASGGTILIADIQGVNDLYTDPQIHSKDELEFGKGNLAEAGMKAFKETHVCNPLCTIFVIF